MTQMARVAARLTLLALLPFLGLGCQAGGGTARVPESVDGFAEDDFDEFDEFSDFDEFDDEPTEEVFDPLSGYNRMMFAVNDALFLWVWTPIAKGYRYVVPEAARVAVGRAFTNLASPARLVNSLLQLKFEKAGLELGRAVVNTTIGIGGLFDPADAWFDWRAPSPEDFGQTLATYGVGSGFPVVIPFLGPSNVRDGLALVPDGFLHPARYLLSSSESVGLWLGGELNATSLRVGEYESLKSDALDLYTLFRDAYQQYRDTKIEE